MTERNASEIQVYLAEDMKLHDFLALVEVDMPRVLEVAVKLREALLYAIAIVDTEAYDLGDIIQKRHEGLLNDTKWLEEDTDGSTRENLLASEHDGGG